LSAYNADRPGLVEGLCFFVHDAVERQGVDGLDPNGVAISMNAELLIAFFIAYLIGSIPFGYLLTRLSGRGDIRAVGSGNIGATNVLRTGSKGLAAATLLLDIAKGALAVWIGRQPQFGGAETYAAAGVLIGHLYPVWLRFRGGKGVATLLGVLAILLPIAGAVYALVWVGLLATVRISSVAGIAAALSAPVTAAFLGADRYFPMLLGFALLVVWKHRANIVRLRAGTEPPIGQSKG
jgi:glycerol-3-phosphate acyltransferase PlsY